MCLTHTLSDVSSVFFDHTAPGIESQDRGVERQNMQSFWEIYGKHIQSSGGDYLYQKQPLISLNCMWSSIVLEFCLLFHLFLFGFGLKPSKSTCQGKPLDTLSPWISRCQDTSRPGNLLEETWMVWMKVEMAWPVKDHFVHPKRFEGNVFLPCCSEWSKNFKRYPQRLAGFAGKDVQLEDAVHSLRKIRIQWDISCQSTIFYHGFVYCPRIRICGFAMLHPSPKSSGLLHCSHLEELQK